jgi:ABC-type nitrate/sulfonate/bicarbonate transport system substrate-binding protein
MALIGNTDWLRQHETAATGVYRALARGLTFLREHPAEARAVIRKRLSTFEESAFQAGYDSTLKGFPPTPEVDLATAERIKSFIETVDHAPMDVPAAKLVDIRTGALAAKLKP